MHAARAANRGMVVFSCRSFMVFPCFSFIVLLRVTARSELEWRNLRPYRREDARVFRLRAESYGVTGNGREALDTGAVGEPLRSSSLAVQKHRQRREVAGFVVVLPTRTGQPVLRRGRRRRGSVATGGISLIFTLLHPRPSKAEVSRVIKATMKGYARTMKKLA